MSDIKVVRKHNLPIPHAKKVAQKAADDLAREYDLESEWNGDTLNFTRSGVDGKMAVTANEIRIGVSLGFLLKAFRQKIQQHVEDRLDELLMAASPGVPDVASAKRTSGNGASASGKGAAGKSAAGKSASSKKKA